MSARRGKLKVLALMENVLVPPDEPGEALFERIAIEVKLQNGGKVNAWAYGLKKPLRARLIGSGYFIADRRVRNPRPVRP